MMSARVTPAVRRRHLFLLAGNLLLLSVIYSQLDEGASFGKVLSVAGSNVTAEVVAGLGLTGIIIAGALDLSIGSILAMSGTVFGIFFYYGFAPVWCFAGCVATAWGMSMLNGYLIRWLAIPAVIVTLAGLTFYRGLALVLASVAIPNSTESIMVHNEAYHTPAEVFAAPILFVVAAAAVVWEAFGKTPRMWLAVGCSREACRIDGLAPGRILQSAFCAGGLFLGVAALIDVTDRQYIEPARLGLGFELGVIGAVVLGGTNIFGGEGSYVGTILGAFFLYFVAQVMLYLGVDATYREFIRGALITGVIAVDCGLHRRAKMLEELR